MKILVGISGGVDSAFAAKKIKDEGHLVEGAVLKMHEYTELEAAMTAAENIGIALHVIDCTSAFDNRIRKNFVEEYLCGRTPNPCIICNEQVKFRFLYDYAVKMGFDAIATGHYAKLTRRTVNGEIRYSFEAALDTKKDQSYMLYRLPQEILAKLILPLGDVCKTDVREEAASYGIRAADKPDSQEICFLPDGDYPSYIEMVAGKCPEGDFINEDGDLLGKHKGIIHYTVGQRKGLGISLGERAFVTKIDPENNTVTLSPSHKGQKKVFVKGMVYSGMCIPRETVVEELDVKLRYSSSAISCVAELNPDGTAVLNFESYVKAAPGQSAVLYRDGVLICGGFIVS